MHIQDKNKFNKIYIESQNIQITEANTCYCLWQTIGTTVLTCCSGYNVPTIFCSGYYVPTLFRNLQMYKCGRGPDFQNITSQPPSLPQFDPFPLHDLSPALKQQYHIGCHKWSRNCFTFLSTRVHPGLERNSCCSILRVLCSIL
jgi:hypothetical protein